MALNLKGLNKAKLAAIKKKLASAKAHQQGNAAPPIAAMGATSKNVTMNSQIAEMSKMRKKKNLL